MLLLFLFLSIKLSASFDFYPWERINYPQPAQIQKFKIPLIEASLTDFFVNVKDVPRRFNVLYIQPFKPLSIGVNYNVLSFNEMYKEELYDLTLSKEFKNFISGVSLLQMNKRFSGDLREYSDSKSVFNLGLRLKTEYPFSPGIFFKDILSDEKESFGFELSYFGEVLSGRFLISYDRNKNFNVDSVFKRWFFKNTFSFKTGISIGSKNYRLVLFSFSYIHLNQFLLEYDFYLPFSGIRDVYGTHILKLKFYFSRVKKEEIRIVEGEEPDYYLEAEYYISQDELLKAWGILKKGLRDNIKDYKLKELSLIVRDKLIKRADVFKDKAEKFLKDGEYSRASDYYEKAIEVFPDYEEVYKMRNALKDVLKYFKKAETPLLKKAVGFYIENRKRDSLLILTYLSDVYKDKNIERFKKFVERETEESFEKIEGLDIVKSKLLMALNYIYEGRFDKAVLECRDVLVIDEKNVLALKRMGSSLYAIGKKKEAEKYWKEALKINPDDKEIKEFLSGKKAKVVLNFKKIYMEGLSFLAKKDFEKAIEKFKIILNNDSIPPDFRKKAEERYKEADNLRKERNKLMKLYFGEGMYYYKKGDYKKAIKKFKKVIELKPGHPQSRRLIEKCRKMLKD